RMTTPSAWRPRHVSPSKQMQMQMRHRLSTVTIRVDPGSIARFGNSLSSGDVRRDNSQASDNRRITDVVQRCGMLTRNHEDVHGCLRIDVAERHAVGRLVNEVGRNLLA